MEPVPAPPGFLVLGTAHVVDLSGPIRATLAGRPLDGIAVELDAERAALILQPAGTEGRPVHIPFFARLWSLLQRRLGADLGAGLPGAEMRTAADIARERHLPLYLIDDPVRAMLNRLLATMPPKERISLLVGSIVGLVIPTRVVKEQMEEYVEQPGEIVAELRRASPTIARVLLDERNEHMADRLADLHGRGVRRLAVVVGDAHVEGLVGALHRRGIETETVGFAALRRLTGPSASPS